MRQFAARLRRLEQAHHAADHARPTPEEMRAAVLDPENARPVVLAMLDRFRAFSMELESATVGFCRLPNANTL